MKLAWNFYFFVGTINSKRHFIRKIMAMWFKLTSTVRRQKRDSKSLYYFFSSPRKVCLSIQNNRKIFWNTYFISYILPYLPYFSLSKAFSPVSHVFLTHNLTRSPPFELRALLSERLEQANHILFTSLSLCLQDQSAMYNFYHVKCTNLNSDMIA